MWRPSAPLKHLRARAHLLQTIRDFFAKRQVMEVETPVLCRHSVTDPHIQSIAALCQFQSNSQAQTEAETYYLQTSPEYAMKRLLAAGCGAIFQMSKAFRAGEIGRLHNPEFTMLEWYRPGFNHHHLMDEVDELLQLTLKSNPARRFSYAQLFQTYLGIDPHRASIDELVHCLQAHDIIIEDTGDKEKKTLYQEELQQHAYLDLLLSQVILPHMPKDELWFIHDFPATQAALAKITGSAPPVAARFEVYYQGIELANGFHELQDAREQRSRFEKNLSVRQACGLPLLSIDEHFMSALSHGLPDCAGVALGIDRLMLVATESSKMSEVMSFDFHRV